MSFLSLVTMRPSSASLVASFSSITFLSYALRRRTGPVRGTGWAGRGGAGCTATCLPPGLMDGLEHLLDLLGVQDRLRRIHSRLQEQVRRRLSAKLPGASQGRHQLHSLALGVRHELVGVAELERSEERRV